MNLATKTVDELLALADTATTHERVDIYLELAGRNRPAPAGLEGFVQAQATTPPPTPVPSPESQAVEDWESTPAVRQFSDKDKWIRARIAVLKTTAARN